MRIIALVVVFFELFHCFSQIYEDKVRPFIGEGPMPSFTINRLTKNSFDVAFTIPLEDSVKLLILHVENNQYTKISENLELLQGVENRGDAGWERVYFDDGKFIVDIGEGSYSYLRRDHYVFEKNNEGKYYFREYLLRVLDNQKEDIKERKYISFSDFYSLPFEKTSFTLMNEYLVAGEGISPNIFNDKNSVVEGVVKSKWVYGAPNYGETPEIDEKIKMYYLEVNPSISIYTSVFNDEDDETSEQPVYDVKEIQLAIAKNIVNLSLFEGKKAELKGVFMNISNGHDYKSVIFNIQAIKK